jgi:hypothetical protein
MGKTRRSRNREQDTAQLNLLADTQTSNKCIPLIVNRRRKLDLLPVQYPGHKIIDLTSQSSDSRFSKFSPFYPHADIPVPFSTYFAWSVEGVWQGLKVFERKDGSIEDIDLSCFGNSTGKNIKRGIRAKNRLRCLGHRRVSTNELMNYFEARKLIYLPTYRFILENRLQEELKLIQEHLQNGPVIFLDYNTNADITNLTRPLSHAALVAKFILDQWPSESTPSQTPPPSPMKEKNPKTSQ